MSTSKHDMYHLLQHLELSHPENGESPFIATNENIKLPLGLRVGKVTSSSDISCDDEECEEVYVDCPEHCGEAITFIELVGHLELHRAEGIKLDNIRTLPSGEVSPHRHGGMALSTGSSSDLGLPNDTGKSDCSQMTKRHRTHSAQKRQRDHYSIGDWRDLLRGPSVRKARAHSPKPRQAGARRLGKAELGPHAYEEQMPRWLQGQLEHGAKRTVENKIGADGQIIPIEEIANETRGIVPVLAQLCELDPALSKAFLCHSEVKHIFKMAREGGFCGYRNIQMLLSFVQATKFPGYQHFPGRTPNILRLQDLIEEAWDKGFNSSGRVETGGIRGTRKYIGTPEAQALLCSLKIGCEANAFMQTDDIAPVHSSVFQAVLEYFSAGVTDLSSKVYKTNLPPIYFQHPGHSLTIVGLEIRKSGNMNLLVLDPMFKTSPGMCRLLGLVFRQAASLEKLLKAYRRGDTYLRKYTSFEILRLTQPHTVLALGQGER